MNKHYFIFLLSFIVLYSCTEETKNPVKPPLTAVIEQDINASHANYQYYSFATGDTLPFADSSTANWDIAFKGTSVIVNGGTGKAGVGGVIIMDTLFSEVTEAPTAGYVQESASAAIPTGSNNGWYNYAGPPNHTITPLAGKVFVIKTGAGKYAKMEFISYYKGAPATPNGLLDISKYYTIRFVYQADGSTSLK
ncbi:MAG: HmuY family protein [Chitinophagales bacterium]